MSDDLSVLWLTPDKPENISVGRQRIADHLENAGFRVTVRGTTPGTVLQSLRERKEYDAVVGTTRAGAFAGGLLKLFSRRPLVVDHVDPIRQFEETHPQWLATLVRLCENVAFSFADHVLFVYGEERERVARYADSFSETDLGVEVERFRDPDSEFVSAATERLDDRGVDGNVAVYVGGLEPIYHIEELLTAMSHLPTWSLVVIGDGGLRETVETAAAEHENIHYLGLVPHEHVPGYLHAADAGVSLVDDPHTLKVLEYGIAGLSVVQAAGRAEERFGDQVEYCEPNPESIAETIDNAVSNTDIQSFVAEYDWERIADDYRKVLISII